MSLPDRQYHDDKRPSVASIRAPSATDKLRRHRIAFGPLLEIGLLLGTAWGLCALLFVGYQGMDDLHYVVAAERWFLDPPFIGENQWHNRLPMVLAMATSFRLFGETEWALVAPNVLLYSLFVVGFWAMLRRWFGQFVAVTASLLLITMPLFAIYTTIPYPFTFETVLVVSGCGLLIHTVHLQRRDHLPAAILAGLCLGIAILNRQTAVAALLALAPLGLLSLERWRSWLATGLSLGALGIGEFLWYWSATGDPFHRLQVDAEGHRIPSAHLEGGTFEGSPFFNVDLMSRWKPAGTFDVHWLVNPYLDFFTSPNFGLVMWLAVPALLLMLYHRSQLQTEERRVLAPLILLAVVWFLVIVYVLSLRPQARYFGPIMAVSAMVAGLGLRQLLLLGYTRLTVGLLLVVVGTNLLLAGARDRPLRLEREMVKLASTVDGVVHAPAQLLARAGFFVRSGGLGARLSGAPATPGSHEILLLAPGEAPLPGLTVVGVAPRQYRPLGRVLAGLAGRLGVPGHLREHLAGETTSLILVQR